MDFVVTCARKVLYYEGMSPILFLIFFFFTFYATEFYELVKGSFEFVLKPRIVLNLKLLSACLSFSRSWNYRSMQSLMFRKVWGELLCGDIHLWSQYSEE